MARPFDPAQWLAQFVAMGGRYANTSAGIWIDGPAELDFLALQNEVLRDADKREAVKAHILARTPQEALPC